MTTEQIVAWFLAGLTVEEIATRNGCPRLKVEGALRRWMSLREP